jgi:pyruvate dehydrogenase E2 component (dihydrolipoamide acetyltransferase)
MSQIIEVKVPDIGDFSDVPVIDLFVKVGDSIKVDDAIATLESDKATMDVPSTVAGVVKEVLVQLGSKVSEGVVLIKVEAGGAAAALHRPRSGCSRTGPAAAPAAPRPPVAAWLKSRCRISATSPTCRSSTCSSRSATASRSTTRSPRWNPTRRRWMSFEHRRRHIKEVLVQLGSKVGEGTVLIKVERAGHPPPQRLSPASAAPAQAAPAAVSAPVSASTASIAPAALAPALPARFQGARLAVSPRLCPRTRRRSVQGAATGPKNRIVKEDLTKYVKGVMSGAISGPVASATGGVVGGGVLDLLPWPKVDFAKFGEIEVKPLSRIKKISGQNLSRNWVMIPAVTYHEDADITDIEAFRVLLNKENEKGGGAKLTMLAFLMKACVKGLQKFPEFNSSLDGDNLVLKKYFNIGFAADTPNGLVVPVVKNADKKSVFELAQESGDLAKQARDGKLKPADMSGACFTISSLGGIGGTYFAPIVNAPEVAILGVNKSAMKPVWDGKAIRAAPVLPLSLTADHRVIDGALATRFNVYIAQLLADFRRVAL